MRKFPELRYRQVHLDFHTSEWIENVGANFDEQKFISALRRGHVNSVTAFAVCHHGWSYYPTRVGECHPHLATPLLPRMLAAAKEADIDMPVYITVGWNERIGRLHPEWVVRNREGVELDWSVKDGVRRSWKRICLNTPYLDHLEEVTREVMELYRPIGIFYDIIRETPCYCECCRRTMADRGIDPDDPAATAKLGTEILIRAMERLCGVIHSIRPDARVYWNGPDRKGRDDIHRYDTHYEIESLPTADWCGGYEHFPQNGRYFRAKGIDALGQTGKFHESWGEFGGFKSVAALRYECMRILMLGLKCSIGDQMQPDGSLEEPTYRLIGAAYEEVERKEPSCRNTEMVAEIAILAPSAVSRNPAFEDAETGAAMMLGETGRLFDVIDAGADFGRYRILVLPDEVEIDQTLAGRLRAFIASGGRILASGESVHNLDCGAEPDGVSPWYIDYIEVGPELSGGMVSSRYFNAIPGVKTRVTDGEVLARVLAPCFNRTEQMFCSHGNTPCSGRDAGYPGVVRKGNVIYLAHKVFTMYRRKGMKLHRDLVDNCLALLDPKPLVRVEHFPSAGVVSLMRREDKYILHLLYGYPVMRGSVGVVEDIVPLQRLKVRVRLPQVGRVRLVPENIPLPFNREGEYCCFEIPELSLHQMVELEMSRE